MLRELTQEDIDSGDLIDADEFVGDCKTGMFTDYDGFGHYVFDGEYDDKMVSPSDILSDIPDDVTHILWFNR